MKEENPEQKRRLLDDLWQDEATGAWAAAARQRALGAFRRERRWKQVSVILRVAAAFVVVVAGVFLLRPNWSKDRAHSQPELPRMVGARDTVVAGGIQPIPALTDEELVASFPPHSCYIAEVDGRKILIFADTKLQKEYLP